MALRAVAAGLIVITFASPVAAQGVHVRAGVNGDIGGCTVMNGYVGLTGPAFGASFRIGVALAPELSVIYQNAFFAGYARAEHTHGGVADFNSILLAVTLFDRLDVAIGPSGDIVYVIADRSDLSGFGGHGRLAWSFAPAGSTRGLTLGADIHFLPLPDAFTAPPDNPSPGGTLLVITAGMGYEWR